MSRVRHVWHSLGAELTFTPRTRTGTDLAGSRDGTIVAQFTGQMLRRLALALVPGAAVLACLLASQPAQAGGRVLVASDSTLFVRSARIAQARAPKWTTEWLSLDVDGGPGRFVLVVPVAAGTKLDPALAAFFSAIDSSTAPRIRPPKPVLACGATQEGSLEDTSSPPLAAVVPSAVAILDDLTQVDSFAIAHGVAFGADDASSLGSLGAARFVALVYDMNQGTASTETVRRVVPVPDAPPGLALLASDAAPDVTLFSIAEGRASLSAGIDEITAASIGSEWKVLAGTSSYRQDRRSYLLAALGGVAVIESSGSTPLFGWNVLPGGAGALAPGVKTYFERAKKEGAGVSSADLCVEPVWDAIAAGKAGARLSRLCAPGALVVIPDAVGAKPCDEAPAPGEVSAAPLRCGEADDVAFALAGMRADLVRVTRHTTVAGPQTPALADLIATEGPTVSLLVTAASSNTAGCVSGNAGASGFGGTTGGAGYGGNGAAGGFGASTGYDPNPIPEPEPHVDVQCWAEVGDSCGGGGSGGSDGGSCDGDSSSSDSSGDTCSGDSTGSGDGSGDTCGGDSSGSGEGDTCSGDSSSGAEGDTCSGSDSGGGDSCGSGSGSSGGGDCSVPRQPRRLRVSALSLLFAAILLPLRRITRRRRRGG